MAIQSNGGFVAVNFKLRDENGTDRHLFVKQHDAGGKDDLKPSDRTLFLINVPQCINEKCMKFMYKECGEIERIFIHLKPRSTEDDKNCVVISSFAVAEPNVGFKVVYIVFKNASGLKNALKCKELPPVPLEKFSSSIGMKKWVKEYNNVHIDASSVQKEIDDYMTNYDKNIEESKRKAKEMDSVEDEDGWITITKHSKKPKISRNEAVSNKIIAKQNRESTKKTLLNFYKCQLRQSKMEHIMELRRKFEKDKERIAIMKSHRKFKPF